MNSKLTIILFTILSAGFVFAAPGPKGGPKGGGKAPRGKAAARIPVNGKVLRPPAGGGRVNVTNAVRDRFNSYVRGGATTGAAYAYTTEDTNEELVELLTELVNTISAQSNSTSTQPDPLQLLLLMASKSAAEGKTIDLQAPKDAPGPIKALFGDYGAAIEELEKLAGDEADSGDSSTTSPALPKPPLPGLPN
ncbi:MAG: hypothetical protein AAF585_25185 [Verrucomicrobiota bacterium]